jgi:RES domain-containing protein
VIEAYRLHLSQYPANSSKGAAHQGGRWNPSGKEAIYTAATRSLAALEILVHYAVLPRNFVVTPVRIPDFLIEEAHMGDLPPDWQAYLTHTVIYGEHWLRRQSSTVLSVPSSIVPAERNYVLNPAHPQFGEIEFLVSEPFYFDPRLKQSA